MSEQPDRYTLTTVGANLHSLYLGPHTLHISYSVIVAYAGPAWPVPCRRLNTTATTRRHLGIVGAMGWLRLPDEVFDHILKKAFS